MDHGRRAARGTHCRHRDLDSQRRLKVTATLLDVVNRALPAVPWAEGDNIPWDDPAFSARMLHAHLDQSHDLASRRLETIEQHVDWIHRSILNERPTKILDLTCGPGLYTQRLAKLGHQCVGVDFSPASVAHATEVAEREGLRCTYVEGDVRNVDPGKGFGLAMMVWGQFNVFPRPDAERLLFRVHERLVSDGVLVLEPQSYAHVKGSGLRGPTWQASESGLFSDRPHLVLEEPFWEESTQTSTTRFYIVDAETGGVTRHALSNAAYREEQYEAMLRAVGFASVRFLRSLTGVPEEAEPATHVAVAMK